MSLLTELNKIPEGWQYGRNQLIEKSISAVGTTDIKCGII